MELNFNELQSSVKWMSEQYAKDYNDPALKEKMQKKIGLVIDEYARFSTNPENLKRNLETEWYDTKFENYVFDKEGNDLINTANYFDDEDYSESELKEIAQKIDVKNIDAGEKEYLKDNCSKLFKVCEQLNEKQR